MTTQLTDEFSQLRNEVMNSVQRLNDQQAPTPPVTTDIANQATMYNATLASNAEMLRLIQQLQQQVASLQCVPVGTPTTPSQPPLTPSGSGTRPRGRRTTNKYCYTHGACAHTGFECTNKKEGHKDEATFANKMGGSTYYCSS